MRTSTLFRSFVGTVAVALSLLMLDTTGASAAAGHDRSTTPWYCDPARVDVDRLPQTADALAAWFSSCPPEPTSRAQR